MILKTLTLIFAGLFLIGCSQHALFQPNTVEEAGYRFTEYKITQGYYRISVSSAKHNNLEHQTFDHKALEQQALNRARELTEQQGYDWFVVISPTQQQEVKRQTPSQVNKAGTSASKQDSHIIEIHMGIGVKP
ncbi:hypothetical protein Sden_0570 [Shewanella denitrificans OS217]|jgi:hypothetical protein|uniref:Lipoprotein n=1 Tax=Shewanella denitrificans (strain OS217 / ATCC BAA-1090 / DSM 15013) TaxID=318161 RepID=Q12RR6_SHEDO|nr:hypothetical protein [Shewanella denitrificans]ABE53860.1 hypothetical protein Sden_0570 [Shewanella denitrificans OS217]